MSRKVIIIRHMQERRDDHVANFLNDKQTRQVHVNPAHGAPIPADTKDCDALVIYGGIQSANDVKDKPYIGAELDWITDWLASGRPALGICLGAQLLAKSLGGEISRHRDGIFEIGFHKISPTEQANGFLNESAYFYQWHGEGFSLPDRCELLATGDLFPNQAFRYRHNTYGFQFHPEVSKNVMNSWLSAARENLQKSKGAHSVEKQRTDESIHGDKMGKWCRNFLEDWYQTW